MYILYNTHRYAQNVYVYTHTCTSNTTTFVVYQIPVLRLPPLSWEDHGILQVAHRALSPQPMSEPFCSALRIILNDPERTFFRAKSLVEESRLPWWLSSLTLACGPGSACIHVGRTLYTYIYVHIYIHIYTYIYIYIHIYTYIYMLYICVIYICYIHMLNTH